MSAWNTLPLPPEKKEGPLWLRTQRRLQRMETWSARHRPTESGLDERIQLLDEAIAIAHRRLILVIKDYEERGGAKMT